MSRTLLQVITALFVLLALPTAAAENCKPHSLFTPMPGYHVSSCEYSEFDARAVPIGVDADDESVRTRTVEGIYEYVIYALDEGAAPSPPLKILRNHLAAATAKGATVVWEPKNAGYWMAGDWSDIQQQIATLRMNQGGREYWVHLGSVNDGDYYAIASMSAEAMEQVISVNELVSKLENDGFLRLEVNFDTARATLRPDSSTVLDQASALLREAPAIKVEIAGHTDNVGDADANLALSQQRADSVREALVARGIAADRLDAKGYGASQPVADNRSEEGRAANRRVEMVKR